MQICSQTNSSKNKEKFLAEKQVFLLIKHNALPKTKIFSVHNKNRKCTQQLNYSWLKLDLNKFDKIENI